MTHNISPRFAPLLLLPLVTCSACSPVKGYPGPERPESETALVTPMLNTDSDIPRSATADGIPFGDEGITLLPGNHSIEFIFTRKGGKIDCQRLSTFDDAGYNACLSDKKHRDNCSCWDYVTIRERCLHEVRDANCAGSLTLKAATKYELRPSSTYVRPSMIVTNQSTGQSVKELSCKVSSPTSESFEESIGTGRFTAEQYGVRTACD